MSDFLSNFSNDDYKSKKPKKKSETKKEIPEAKESKELVSSAEEIPDKKKHRRKKSVDTSNFPEKIALNPFDNPDLIEVEEDYLPSVAVSSDDDYENDNVSDDLHEVEIDPEYQKKQRNKKIAIVVASIVTIVLIYFFYYKMTHVKIPDFVDKSVTDVRKWATENRMELDLTDEYSLEKETSNVIKQGVSPGKNVKKGTTLTFTISEGPDPEEVIPLPDFKSMSQNEVQEFVDKNKADNISIINEYSDKIEKNAFSRIEFSDKEVTAETYRRRDSVNVYFSKGAEVFEKNITVPNYVGKMKSEVEEWAKKNSIAMTYEEADSDTVEEGKIISQNIEKDKKIAKNDKMTVVVSLGKAVIVPNYGNYSAETSTTAAPGMEVNVKQVFSDGVPYGQLISQSVETGTKLTGKDSKSIDVVYSYGQPYIRSYFGQLEGEIPKFIYDDFNSKGAYITYDVYYVDSDSEKGSIVKMSVYNQYIASNAYITFGISNGRYASQPGKTTPSTTPETSEADANKNAEIPGE